MKTISGRYFETIAKILCDCCDEEHICLVKKNKMFKESFAVDKEEALFYLDFSSPNYDRPWPGIKERLRVANEFLKNKGDYLDALLLSYEQVVEIYDLFLDNINEFLTDEERVAIDDPDKIFLEMKDITSRNGRGIRWLDIDVFHPTRKDNELVLFFDGYEDDVNKERVYIGQFAMGWKIAPSPYFDWKQKLNRAWRFVRKQGLSCIRQYEISMTREDVIEFLKSISYVFNNIKKDEKGISYLCV
jgi:hypothetical protein